MIKLLILILISTFYIGCASTYRTTITETRSNKISMYVDEYVNGKITKQQLNDLINIYIKEMEK